MSEPGSSGARHALLVAAWALAFTVLGTALGATAVLVGALPTLAPIALGTGGGGAVLSLVALLSERRAASGRPMVLDHRGRAIRPLAAWLYAVPLAVVLVGLIVLVVVGTVYTSSVVVGMAFLGAAVAVAAMARPLWASRELAQALEADAAGAREAARTRWRRLHDAWWVPRAARDQAALDLGLDALRRGDLAEAERWYAEPGTGRVGAHARLGLALVRVVQDRHDEVLPLLERATRGGRSLQREIDGVRLLLVLRRDGPEAAIRLGGRLGLTGAGALFRGALAEARRRAGDEEGAAALLDTATVEALQRSGLDAVIAGAGTTSRP